MSDNSGANDTLLVRTAKKIGAAASRIVSAAGATAAEPPPSSSSKAPVEGKLQKKNKTRLPRRLKKAQLKAAQNQR